MGNLAMGMPFQVFPTGPPPPPPPPKNQPQSLSAPQTNGGARKSPQSFEPPPMGCRPEIKIPENPMATLKKVPRPQQRDDFWVQEYVHEKARNSLPEDQIREQLQSSLFQQKESVPTPPPVAEKPSPQYIFQHQQQKKSPSPEQIPVRNVKLEDEYPMRVHIDRSPVAMQSNQKVVAPQSPITTTKTVTIEPMIKPQPSLQQQHQQPQGYQTQMQQPQGRIILSTMPNRPQAQQQQQQHVSLFFCNLCLVNFIYFLFDGINSHI
jgi:hypothetical protein